MASLRDTAIVLTAATMESCSHAGYSCWVKLSLSWGSRCVVSSWAHTSRLATSQQTLLNQPDCNRLRACRWERLHRRDFQFSIRQGKQQRQDCHSRHWSDVVDSVLFGCHNCLWSDVPWILFANIIYTCLCNLNVLILYGRSCPICLHRVVGIAWSKLSY